MFADGTPRHVLAVHGDLDGAGEVLSIVRAGADDLPDTTEDGDRAWTFSLPSSPSNYVFE